MNVTGSRMVAVVSLALLVSACSTVKQNPQSRSQSFPDAVVSTANNYSTNQDCIDLIKEFEGVRLDAYIGPAGHWLIGYGHKAGVKKGMKISAEKANRLLKEDLQDVEVNVARLLKVKVNRNQYSAMVCLAYNIGWGALSRSTLLKLVNTNNMQDAADEFLKWRMVNKKVSRHQEKRRSQERRIFLK